MSSISVPISLHWLFQRFYITISGNNSAFFSLFSPNITPFNISVLIYPVSCNNSAFFTLFLHRFIRFRCRYSYIIFRSLICSYIHLRCADIYPIREIAVLFSLFSALIIQYYSVTFIFLVAPLVYLSIQYCLYSSSRCLYILILMIDVLIYSVFTIITVSKRWYIHICIFAILILSHIWCSQFWYLSSQCLYRHILVFVVLIYWYIRLRYADINIYVSSRWWYRLHSRPFVADIHLRSADITYICLRYTDIFHNSYIIYCSSQWLYIHISIFAVLIWLQLYQVSISSLKLIKYYLIYLTHYHFCFYKSLFRFPKSSLGNFYLIYYYITLSCLLKFSIMSPHLIKYLLLFLSFWGRIRFFADFLSGYRFLSRKIYFSLLISLLIGCYLSYFVGLLSSYLSSYHRFIIKSPSKLLIN